MSTEYYGTSIIDDQWIYPETEKDITISTLITYRRLYYYKEKKHNINLCRTYKYSFKKCLMISSTITMSDNALQVEWWKQNIKGYISSNVRYSMYSQNHSIVLGPNLDL